MRLQHLNHSTYQHQYHIVWCTRGRRNILQSYVLPELRKSFLETIKKYPTLFLHEMNTDQDHIHIQLEIPPNIAVSDAVRALKAASALHLRKKFPYIRKIYLEKDGIWATGYFSSTIGSTNNKSRSTYNIKAKKKNHSVLVCGKSHGHQRKPRV